MKKHPFFLIEVLIALFIIAICSFLISSNLFRFFKEDYKTAEKLEFQRLADLSFAEIKELLYINAISYPNAHLYNQAPLCNFDKPLEINLFNKKGRKINRSYKIWSPKLGKQDKDGTLYKEITVRVFLDKMHCDYQTVIAVQ